MRFFFLIVLMMVGMCSGFSQHEIVIDEYHIRLEAPEKLETIIKTENSMVYKNENYSIHAFSPILSNDQEGSEADLDSNTTLTAAKFALMIGFRDFTGDGTIPKIKNAGYVITHDETSENSPVLIAIFYDEKRKLTFAVILYCYNNNIDAGRKIMESIELQ